MIAARVQHHPARAALLPALLAALDPLPNEVITDPDPGGLRNPWRTYLRCLTDPPDCSHLLIVQDDVWVCHQFPAALERIAAANPTTSVCLFVSRQAKITTRFITKAVQRRAVYADWSWQDHLPVVAMLWAIDHVHALREWGAAYPNPSRSDDAMAQRWARRHRIRVKATVPSLVEHPDNTPSLIRRQGHAPRNAAVFIGDIDPLSIDWTRI